MNWNRIYRHPRIDWYTVKLLIIAVLFRMLRRQNRYSYYPDMRDLWYLTLILTTVSLAVIEWFKYVINSLNY